MEDIILGGHSIDALKQIKKDIQQDAVKVIATNMADALSKFETLKEVETEEDGKAVAQEIYDHLETVQVVAGVSGCTFMMPWNEEYGNYDHSDIISCFLDDNENDSLQFSWQDRDNPLKKLYNLAENMESDSRAWHSSTC